MAKLKLLPVLAFAVAAIALSACSSFAPVYGDPAADGANLASARFNYAPPENRLEQIIINRLKVAFPAQASPQDPVLDVTAAAGALPGSLSNAFSVARPANVRVLASVTIQQGDQSAFTATRFSDTSYQGGKLTPVDIASADGAQEAAARNVAEALRAAILAGYRPGAAVPLR